MPDYPPTTWLSNFQPNGVPVQQERTHHTSTARATAPGNARMDSVQMLEQREMQEHVALLTQQQQHHNDVAGVLRRNQACLACRRRKLKCDAVRPHCSTCVRSHKHLMRTAPRTNPVLSCEYDDGNTTMHRDTTPASPASQGEEDGEGSRKKRKSAGAGEAKKKKESEAERLKKRIEELEARLTMNQETVQEQVASATAGSSRPTSSGVYRQSVASSSKASRSSEPISADSPTAFLDILSSAATDHAPPPVYPARASSSGLRAGVNGSTMMNGATGTYIPPNVRYQESPQQTSGMTPVFTFDDLQQTSMNMRPPPPTHHDSNESAMSSHSHSHSHQQSGISPFNQSLSSGPSDPIALTPSGIFNFSPGPPEPVNYEAMPHADINGKIQPSNRLDGPWRGIETVDSFVAAAQARAANQYATGSSNSNSNMAMPIDPSTDPSLAIPISMQGGLPQSMPIDDFNIPLEEDLQQQLLMDLFWPGWPPGLPEPHIVNELIEVFFDFVPSLPRMLHRSRFQTRMTLPPTHSNFPHPALLHSICAIAANWCAPSVYDRSTISRHVNGRDGKAMSFSTWQSTLAKESVGDGLNTGNRMFDVLRAMMILSRLFIDETRMLECWAYHGLVARMILPLGLNVRSAELSLKSVMLPPPADPIEREERRAAVWFALYHDTVSSAASGWGTSIQLDELTVPLPVSTKDFESGLKDIPPNPQDVESSDLFTHHPVCDPFVLCLKASILTHRVTKFVRKWKNRHLREDDDLDGMQRPEFRELANSIACFQMSFPYEMRNPCKLDKRKKLDIDLIVAHMLPHTALICLYEPFADVTDSNDATSRRILASAQATVGIVQQLAAVISEASTNFTVVMHSAASICLVTAARTCLLFYRHALNINDDRLATSLRSDIEMIRMALEQFGLQFKIGHHHAQLVAYFLDRASNPTYDKLIAHYPDHPRAGAPPLHPKSDFGVCVLNALNVKRGYWRLKKAAVFSAGPSPFSSTPDSAGGMPMPAPHRTGSGNGGPGGARIETDSPQTVFGGPSRSASMSGGTGTGNGNGNGTGASTGTGTSQSNTLVDYMTGVNQQTYSYGTGTSAPAGKGDISEKDIAFLLPDVGVLDSNPPKGKATGERWLNLDNWLSSTGNLNSENKNGTTTAQQPTTTGPAPSQATATATGVPQPHTSGTTSTSAEADTSETHLNWHLPLHNPHKVHLDGTRHVFGALRNDASSGVGPMLSLPGAEVAGNVRRNVYSVEESIDLGMGYSEEKEPPVDTTARATTGSIRTESPISSSLPTVTSSAAKTGPLLASSAAWFMGPEPGGFRGPRDT